MPRLEFLRQREIAPLRQLSLSFYHLPLLSVDYASTPWLSGGGGGGPLADAFSEIVPIHYLTDYCGRFRGFPRQRSFPVQ